MTLSTEDADQLATVLNQICGATIQALQSGELAQRLEVAAALREFHKQFEEGSLVAPFVMLLVQWLEGARPDTASVQVLENPFRGALRTMLKQVPASASQPERAPAEPISRSVLAQLLSAVVAARAAGDEAVQRQLAAQLVNIHNKLEPEWRARLGPLLENLRALLGGVDARILPEVPDPTYQRLWMSAVELLINADLSAEAAEGQLLARLTHNTIFVARADDEELTRGYLRSLLDVQTQAVESEAPQIAALAATIRAYLQGYDPTPLVKTLQGEEAAAWQRILDGINTPPSADDPATDPGATP